MNENSQNGLAWVFLTTAVALFVIFLTVKMHNGRLLDTEIQPTSQPNLVAQPSNPIQASSSEAVADKTDLIEGLSNSYNVLGSSTAKITIVEFGDFTCIHCQKSFSAVRSIGLKYPDQVRFIWRDRTPNTRSLGLALTAHCAGEQGKFWEMHDLLFSNQSNDLGDTPDDPKLQALIKKAGVNLATFSDCLKSNRNLAKVRKNVTDSERLDVKGTPTWFINGVKFEGAITKTELEAYISAILNPTEPL